MLLSSPQPTPYDLRFRLLGIPVRVHPFFWVMAVLISGALNKPEQILIWVGCVFLSILVHEFGHALAARYFGHHPAVVLHSMGGLAIYGGDRYEPARRRLIILFAGPGAGFVLMALTLLAGSAFFHITLEENLSLIRLMLPFGDGHPGPVFEAMKKLHSNFLRGMYLDLIEINLLWGLLNLLPIWPLDGGQIAMTILTRFDRYQGARRAHVVSLLVAGGIAAYMLTQSESSLSFNVLIFALLAFDNFQALQAIHQRARYGLDDDSW